MSFKAASLPIGHFVLSYTKTDKIFPALKAVLDASSERFSKIQAVDRGLSDDGKKRQLRISYYPPVCDDTGTCNDDVCSPGVVLAPKQETFDLTQCTASNVYTINKEDVRLVDGTMTFTDHASQQLATILPAFRKKLALQVLTLLYSRAGKMPDGNATRRISIANPVNGNVSPVGKWEIERMMEDAQYTGTPFIIGGSEVFNWKKNVATNGAGTQGNNTAQLGDTNMYYDALLKQVVGDGNEHILAFDPSVLKFVSWNKNKGIFATDYGSITEADLVFKAGNDGTFSGVMLDPLYGLVIDVKIHFDSCTEQYNFQLRLPWDLWFMPADTCVAAGVNGIFHFTTCPTVIAPCPTGDTPASPVTPATYVFTPTSANYGYIQNVTVAGQTSPVEANATNIAELTAALNANVAGYKFAVAGSTITYSGYGAITAQTNGGAANGGKDLAFA
jgi:hypothetical protein